MGSPIIYRSIILMKISLPELRANKFMQSKMKLQNGADSRKQPSQYNKIFKTQRTENRTLPHLDETSELKDSTKYEQRQLLKVTNPVAKDISFQSDITAQQMARFLSEDKLLLQKRKRWQSLIRKEDSSLNFSQIREQVDPSKLSDYLQRKHNQEQWKKIRNREEKLYSMMEVKKPYLEQQTKYKSKNIRRFHVEEERKRRMKLKGLQRLQKILMIV